MKTITLFPAKNESWILDNTLKNMSDFSDHIIVSDQNSTDNSREIYKKYSKVIVIDNNNSGHNNSVRWQLLDKARELFGSNNLILCIDADEMISKQAVDEMKNIIAEHEYKPISFSFPWIQLWGSVYKYRNDTVWKNNNKIIAFFDDGKIDYKRELVINDHTSRTPSCQENIHLNKYPLLHYQYINLDQSQTKQNWYKCSELISGLEPKRINHKYSVADNDGNITLKDVPKDWIMSPDINIKYNKDEDWRYREILSWFDKYGIVFFEPLNIWQIDALEKLFIAKTGRKPKPKKFPKILVILNDIKNKINVK